MIPHPLRGKLRLAKTIIIGGRFCMRTYHKKAVGTIIPVTLLVALLLFSIGTVSAISVDGARYIGSIAAGGKDIHRISIGISPDADATDATIEVMGLGQAMDRSFTPLSPTDDISPYSARTFISIDNSSIHIEPGSKKTVTATISIPSNVGPGGRYAAIYIRTLAPAGKSMSTAVLVPVLITISKTSPTISGSISNVDIGDVVIGQPITVKTTLKNTGNYHYTRSVNNVIVKDASGNVVASVATDPSAYSIIPGNTVQYIALPDVKSIPIGTYTVTSNVILEDGKVLDEKTATFTVKTKYIPPVTESNITLSPASAGTLTSPDGRYTVIFPQGAVLGNAVVTMKPYSKDQLKAAPTNAKLGATSFEIAGLSGLLSKDATISVSYSADDLSAAGGDPSQMKLAYYDTANNAWVILPTKVDSGSSTLTTTTNHLGVWTIMVSSSTSTSAAPASAGVGANATKSPLPLSLIISSLAISVIIAGLCYRKRK